MILDILIIIICSGVIWQTGKWFAKSSSNIGDYLHLPRSVKGATLDAMSSSLPELLIAVFSVIAFKKFEVGIGTIVGSAMFNLLIIPGVCVLVAPVAFKVSRELVHRDGMFYVISVYALLAALLYSKSWGWIIPITFVLVYLWYIWTIKRHTNDHRKTTERHENAKNIKIGKELFVSLISLLVIAGASYFLTESAIEFAAAIGVAPIIIAFTIIAAATSFPDTVISVINAKKGDIDDSAANVFGSNIFDILIGLSIPLFLALFFTKTVEISFNQLEVVMGLLGATILVLYFLAESHTLNKKKAWTMLLMYGVFVGYVIFLSLR